MVTPKPVPLVRNTLLLGSVTPLLIKIVVITRCTFRKRVAYVTKMSCNQLNIKQLNVKSNFIENYKIILNNLKLICEHIGNFKQIQTPKLSSIGLVSVNLTVEFISTTLYLQLFSYLKRTYLVI